MQACAGGYKMDCGYYSERWSMNNDGEDRPCIFILINALIPTVPAPFVIY